MSPAIPSKWEWISLGAVLLGVLTLLHGGLVWGSQVLCGGDIVNQAHPLTEFWVAGPWLQGWCAYSFSGRPYFADIQSALLYPPRWLFRAGFPVEHVTTYLCLAHSLFGAVGMYLLLRVRMSHLPGLLGAILWLAGGYTILRYTNGVVTLIYALAWVPWIWWAVELCGPRRPAMTAALALCAAMLFLAGSPQIVFITGVGMAIWAMGRLIVGETTKRDRLWLALHFLAAGLLAFVIIFPQFVASAEYTGAAVGRGGRAQWENLVGDSLGPWLLITNLAPEFFDAGNAEGVYWGSAVGFMESNAYIGIAPLLLAIFGCIGILTGWRRIDPDGRRWFVCLTLLFLIGMVIAFGRFTPIFRILYDFIPGFNLFRVPARWLLWPFGCAIVMAAWGAEMMMRAKGDDAADARPMRSWAVTSAGLAVLTLLLLVFVEPVMRLFGFNPAAMTAEMAQVLAGKSRGALAWAFGLVVIVSLVGFLAVTRRLAAQPAIMLLLVITVMDLARFWHPFRQPLPHEFFDRQELPTETIYHKIDAAAFRDWYFPRTPLIEMLDAEPLGRYFYTDWLYSYMVDEYTREIYTERGMVHGLENMRGYQPLQLESYASDFARIAGVSLDNPAAVGSFLHAPEVIDRTMLDAYNATRILTYEATLGDPAARDRLLALGLEREASFPFRLEIWRNPHAAGWAWVSRDGEWPALDSRIADIPVTLQERSSGLTKVAVAVPEGGAWLHFSEVDYPGWEIQVSYDGSTETVVGKGRSIHLPYQGTYSYQVRHVFRLPAASRVTLPLSALAVILLISFIGWRGLSGRRGPTPQDTKLQS